MKISLIPLICIILACLFKNILSSNPDSVVVQDSSEDNGEKKSAPLRMEDPSSVIVPDSSEDKRRSKSAPIRIEHPDSVIVLDSSKGNGRSKSAPIRMEDPDSVIVRDSSKSNGRNRSAPMRVEDGQQRPLRGDERPRGFRVVRIMRPYVIGSKTVLREIGLQSFDEVGDRDPLFSVWRDHNNNRRILSGSTGQNAFRARPYSSSLPQKPQNNDERNNGRVQVFGGETVSNLPSYDESIKSLPGTDRSGFINRNSGGAQFVPPPQSNYNSQNRRQQGYNPNSPRFGTNAANSGERRAPLPTQTSIYQRQRPPPVPENTSNRRVAPDSKLFASIVNNFAFKFVDAVNLESNFVVSPLSIFIALSMCYLGSDGRTKIQLEQVLGMNDNAVHGQRLHQGIMDLMSLVTAESSKYELFSANGMFLGKNFTPNALFGEDMKRYYAAELMNLDFGNPQASVPVINDWIAKNTGNMITNLISMPPPLQTRLLLVNAIYFRGIWKTMFPLNLTADGPFRSADGTNKEVPTMTLMGESFPFFRSDEHRHSFIKLPYDGDQMSMIIALPYGESDKPMPSVTDQILCNLREAMVNTQLYAVSIPKFRLEFMNSLRRGLMQLGITDIFNRNVVNMSKLREENDVYVSAILHEAVVEVDEEGTTGASATAVRFVPLIRNTTSFVVSHPFAFYIVHERSGLVLFYGKIFDLNGKPSDNRRESVNVRPRPNFENNRRENVYVRPLPNPEDNRRENIRPLPNPEDNGRENVNFRPRPNPEENRREDVNVRPILNPEGNRRENVNSRLRPNPEDNRRENVNIGPRPNQEDYRRENSNVRPRPSAEGFGGTTVNRNPSRIRVHGAVNFEDTD